MKKLLLLLFMSMFLITLVNATDITNIGITKQYSSIELYQTCDNCTYVNLSSVRYPNLSIGYFNSAMTKISNDFNYSFNKTNNIGNYQYTVCGDKNGVFKCEVIGFEVTLNGKKQADGIVVVIFSIIFIAIFFFGIIAFFKALELVTQFKLDLIDTTVLVGTYLGMWFFYYINYEYLGNALMNSILEMTIMVGAFTHVILPIVAFLVSFIMTNLQAKKKSRITY